MECSEPGAIRDEELMAYLMKEDVRPAVDQHLARCQYCSSQLATYRRMELQLRRKLYRWDCPPSQVLGEYQIGMLSAEQALTVQSHLYTCVLCTADVLTLTEFLANDSRLVEPIRAAQEVLPVHPAAVNNHHVQDVKRVLDHVREQSLQGVRRIVAALLPQQPRLAYQRDGAAPTTSWPRRYSAEDVSISVQVERGPGRKDTLQLIGLVTRKGTALESLQGILVYLVAGAQADQTIYTQTIDELGNFVFPSLAPATYVMELQFPEGIIVIDDLPVALQKL